MPALHVLLTQNFTPGFSAGPRAALTRLLISNNVVDKAKLERVVNEIDTSDGKSDNTYDGEIA